MVTYSVADAAEMLGVNGETIRRWIRNGKLRTAIRAVGRGGSSLHLEDIVAFANEPPKNYLLPLARWLDSKKIPFTVCEDSESLTTQNISSAVGPVLGAGAAAAGAATAVLSTAALPFAVLGVGLSAVFSAFTATKSILDKNNASYSIHLLPREDYSDYAVLDESESPVSERPKEVKYFPVLEIPQQRILCDVESDESDGAGTIMSNASADESSIGTVESKQKCEESDIEYSENIGNVHSAVPTTLLQNETNASGALKDIAFAKKLLDDGIITLEEFAEIKAKLIAKI